MDEIDETQEPAQRSAELRPLLPLSRFLQAALKEVVGPALLAILIASAINVFVAQARVIDGPSMQPNLYRDHRVLVERLTYRFLHGPYRGDIVIIDVPGQDESLVKRVVALPGETVRIQDRQIYIDGEPLQEPWNAWHGGPDFPPTAVSPTRIFVLGDNRGSSRDSRSFGPVRMDQIVGQVRLVYWPLERAGWVK